MLDHRIKYFLWSPCHLCVSLLYLVGQNLLHMPNIGTPSKSWHELELRKTSHCSAILWLWVARRMDDHCVLFSPRAWWTYQQTYIFQDRSYPRVEQTGATHQFSGSAMFCFCWTIAEYPKYRLLQKNWGDLNSMTAVDVWRDRLVMRAMIESRNVWGCGACLSKLMTTMASYFCEQHLNKVI